MARSSAAANAPNSTSASRRWLVDAATTSWERVHDRGVAIENPSSDGVMCPRFAASAKKVKVSSNGAGTWIWVRRM
ncbi:MAG TPA: hypothetical protein VIM15_04095 [Gemmatimonadaceae bacterium]